MFVLKQIIIFRMLVIFVVKPTLLDFWKPAAISRTWAIIVKMMRLVLWVQFSAASSTTGALCQKPVHITHSQIWPKWCAKRPSTKKRVGSFKPLWPIQIIAYLLSLLNRFIEWLLRRWWWRHWPGSTGWWLCVGTNCRDQETTDWKRLLALRQWIRRGRIRDWIQNKLVSLLALQWKLEKFQCSSLCR